MTVPRPPSLGLRHAALRVTDLARVEEFFVRVLGYEVAWRPDADDVYLRRDQDDVALHRDPGVAGPGRAPAAPGAAPAGGRSRGLLDHLGIFVERAEDVDAWARWLDAAGADVAARPRTHRDGARSLYVNGPEGIVVQVLHHPRALGR